MQTVGQNRGIDADEVVARIVLDDPLIDQFRQVNVSQFGRSRLSIEVIGLCDESIDEHVDVDDSRFRSQERPNEDPTPWIGQQLERRGSRIAPTVVPHARFSHRTVMGYSGE